MTKWPRKGPLPVSASDPARRVVGVIGELILSKLVDLRQEDGDEITATLLAAVFADALRKDQTPRTILDSVWAALPGCDAWDREIETTVLAAIELRERI